MAHKGYIFPGQLIVGTTICVLSVGVLFTGASSSLAQGVELVLGLSGVCCLLLGLAVISGRRRLTLNPDHQTLSMWISLFPWLPAQEAEFAEFEKVVFENRKYKRIKGKRLKQPPDKEEYKVRLEGRSILEVSYSQYKETSFELAEHLAEVLNLPIEKRLIRARE